MTVIFKPGRCSNPGCLERSTHVPTVCVPKRGIVSKRTCYEAVFDIPCCLKHVKTATVRDLMNMTIRNQFILQANASNGAPPDFNRAYLNWEPMAGEKYQKILADKIAKMNGKQ